MPGADHRPVWTDKNTNPGSRPPHTTQDYSHPSCTVLVILEVRQQGVVPSSCAGLFCKRSCRDLPRWMLSKRWAAVSTRHLRRNSPVVAFACFLNVRASPGGCSRAQDDDETKPSSTGQKAGARQSPQSTSLRVQSPKVDVQTSAALQSVLRVFRKLDSKPCPASPMIDLLAVAAPKDKRGPEETPF